MKQELEQNLIRQWPKWFGDGDGFSFECGDGWYPLIWSLCFDLNQLVPHDFHVMQVKEKFGGLRFYISYGTMDAATSDIVDQRISKAEDESLATCEVCAQPGEVDYSRSWYRCRCLTHRIAEDNAAEQEDKTNAKDETS